MINLSRIWQLIKSNITFILLTMIIVNESITNIELWNLNHSLQQARITIDSSISRIDKELKLDTALMMQQLQKVSDNTLKLIKELEKDTDKLAKAFTGWAFHFSSHTTQTKR